MRRYIALLIIYLAMALSWGGLTEAATAKLQKPLCQKTLGTVPSEQRLAQLNQAILQMPKEERRLWISPEIDWFEENFANQTALIEGPLPYESRTFDRSFKQVVTLFDSGRRFDNTWVLINGDLFLEGYYRETRYFENEHRRNEANTSELAQLPYFRFDATTHSYQYSRSGAHRILLNHLEANSSKDGKVTLYRGLGKAQTYYLQLLKELNQTNVDLKSLRQLSGAIQTEWSAQDYSAPWVAEFAQLFKGVDFSNSVHRQQLEAQLIEFFLAGHRWKESLFSTPTLEKAEGYADPYVMQAEVSVAELRALAEQNQLYVGVEFEDYELLFYGPDAVRLFAKNARLRK